MKNGSILFTPEMACKCKDPKCPLIHSERTNFCYYGDVCANKGEISNPDQTPHPKIYYHPEKKCEYFSPFVSNGIACPDLRKLVVSSGNGSSSTIFVGCSHHHIQFFKDFEHRKGVHIEKYGHLRADQEVPFIHTQEDYIQFVNSQKQKYSKKQEEPQSNDTPTMAVIIDMLNSILNRVDKIEKALQKNTPSREERSYALVAAVQNRNIRNPSVPYRKSVRGGSNSTDSNKNDEDLQQTTPSKEERSYSVVAAEQNVSNIHNIAVMSPTDNNTNDENSSADTNDDVSKSD